MLKKVAVVFGGGACEREISVITGTFACNLLRGGKYDVLPIFLDEEYRAFTSDSFFEIGTFRKKDFLKKGRRILIKDGGVYELTGHERRLKKICQLSAALNCCHGGLGEGGGVSALFELQGVPLASPSIAPSSVCMDKAMTKLMAKGLNIPVVDGIRVKESDYRKRGEFLLKNMVRRLKFPVIVKPNCLGSSIGITVAENEEEVKRALEAVYVLDDCALIERFLADKKDVNCAAYSLDGEVYVSEAEEAFSSHGGFYGFEQKYIKKEEKGGGRVLLRKLSVYLKNIT